MKESAAVLSDAEILKKYGENATVSGHFPFRGLEMLQRAWKRDTPIIRMEIGGSFTKALQQPPIIVSELDTDVVGGYSVDHTIEERFRYDAVLNSPTGKHLCIQKIFQEIMKPRVIDSANGVKLRVVPTTLYVREFTVQVLGKKYIFEGKVPKEVLKDQAKEWKKKGDKDKTYAILDLKAVHTLAELLALEKMFPPRWFFKRVCISQPQLTASEKRVCVEIWNTGESKPIGE